MSHPKSNMPWQGIINSYIDFLPEAKNWQIVSLNEGNTPLLFSKYLSKLTNNNVYLKIEGQNPTGSFKDRGMTMAASEAFHLKKTTMLCASTGNTSASAAAYAAHAGIKCVVLIPTGKIATAKLSQAVMHGAKIIQVDGNFDCCSRLAREIAKKNDSISLVNSVNPVRIAGQRTAAFEIIDALGDAPDFHFLPVGNAGNITSYWQGYKMFNSANKSTKLPKMIGIQASGSAPLVLGEKVPNPETIATAIRIGDPSSWNGAMIAKNESGGEFLKVTDEEILNAYRLLAAKVGVFAEPASSASIAGLLYMNETKTLPKEKTIVCTLTGNGLKDSATAMLGVKNIYNVDANIDSVLRVLD